MADENSNLKEIYPLSVAAKELGHLSDKGLKAALGGKGAALVQMGVMGLPVPPAFIIPTHVCNQFRHLAEDSCDPKPTTTDFLDELMVEVMENMQQLAAGIGYAPLVSVRSGAPVSMPGMMDTILNVGLTSETLPFWSSKIGERAALDSYRRLIQMMGSTAFDVPHSSFENALAAVKEQEGVDEDRELSAEAMKAVVARCKTAFAEATGHEFPDNVVAQLRAAICAVFGSWMNPRAIHYRKMNDIDEGMGTAVNVQAMVFGNTGPNSGSGVLFTRDPSTGKPVIMAEYLADAQGEDVVAGVRTPEKLHLLSDEGWVHPHKWFGDLAKVCQRLEAEYKDMVDVEFTVQDGELYILQSRVGKRSARAALRIAHDLALAGVIDTETALGRITPDQFTVLSRPMIDPKFDKEPDMVGLPACPGIVVGVPALSSDDAINCKKTCILVTDETTPDDIAGMNAAAGVLTKTGGATSHAAVVARAMDKPCVVGCAKVGGIDWSGVEKVTIDGATGRVWIGVDVPVVNPEGSPEIAWLYDEVAARSVAKVSKLVPCPDTKSQTVTVSDWWGDVAVLSAVMNRLGNMDCQGVSLDVTPPHRLVCPGDFDLADMFGDNGCGQVTDEFTKTLGKALANKDELFPGLDHIVEKGATKPVVPRHAPIEYLVYQYLGKRFKEA